MDEINALLRPSWGAERWIWEGWNQTTAEEKDLITSRLDAMFKDGLPFELKHDKLSYIHAFSLLAQLEVLAIQIPLKFESRLADPTHKKLMRNQLLDEIFHGLVFTKIVYLLCAPHALPPAYSEKVEQFCNYVRNENDPKIAVVLLNLISESWIEEIFYCFKKKGIAPKVFDTIIDDEHRHVTEAELYSSIGLPDKNLIAEKIAYMEDLLSENIVMQYKYLISFSTLLGYQASLEYLQSLDIKHRKQLDKLKLAPSDSWQFYVKIATRLFSGLMQHEQSVEEAEQSPFRKFLINQWKVPSDPTMVGQFNLNITAFNYFKGQYKHETLMLLIMQAISLMIYENDYWRRFIDRKRLYTTKDTLVGLIVRLPHCDDQLGTIVLKNCHELTMRDLALKVRSIRKKMAYCYKKCRLLEEEYPHLLKIIDKTYEEISDSYYGCQIPAPQFPSLSDLSTFGYSQAKSPLRPDETFKFTMLEIEPRPVWNHESEKFEPQDMLAMSISADHRVLDGATPVRQPLTDNFARLLSKMQNEPSTPVGKNELRQDNAFKNSVEFVLENNLEMGYKFLSVLSLIWSDDILAADQVFSPNTHKKNLMNVVNYYAKKAFR